MQVHRSARRPRCLSVRRRRQTDPRRQRTRQPLYEDQRTLLSELVQLLMETGRDNLEPIFAADWEDAADTDAQLRVVIDQVASLTDVSATQWHSYLVKGEAPDATLF